MSKAARLRRNRDEKEKRRRRWPAQKMIYMFTGSSDQSSYNYTTPETYIRKADRNA